VIGYSLRADILAVGLKGRLDFLETQNYTTIHQVQRTDKVSAIQWCPGSALLCGITATNFKSKRKTVDNNHPSTRLVGASDLVAVAGLDGQVSLYQMNVTSLEFEGADTLYEFYVDGQVRCMAMKPMERMPGFLLLVVGDKSGCITLCTLFRDEDGEGGKRIVASREAILVEKNDPVLGLDIFVGNDKSSMIIAYGTKSGIVNVQALEWQGKRIVPGRRIWSTQRSGPVRSLIISKEGRKILFGGYDKRVVLVDTKIFAIVRDLPLDGTINTISLDPLDRFFVVGCRDKSLTFFDTSTCKPIKRFPTPGWVTSISWGVPGVWADVVAVRSHNKALSLLDLTPTHITDKVLPADQETETSSVSWSPDGFFLARLVGDSVHVVDARYAFSFTAKIDLPETSPQCIAFSPVPISDKVNHDKPESLLACVGLDGVLRLLRFTESSGLEEVHSVFVEGNLWVVTWSRGKLLVGKSRN
jgi:WD40 repeat protein